MTELPCLTLPGMPKGSHTSDYDLTLFLYPGVLEQRRDRVEVAAIVEERGSPCADRLTLVKLLYDEVCGMIASGVSLDTVKGYFQALRHFFTWADANIVKLSIDSLERAFYGYAEERWQVSNVRKTLKLATAYRSTVSLAGIFAKVLNTYEGGQAYSARHLMARTRLRYPKERPQQNEKVSAQKAAEMGRLLVNVCESLTADAVYGPLPIVLDLPNGSKAQWPARMVPLAQVQKSVLSRARRARTQLAPGEWIGQHSARAAAVNQRIEAEWLLFVGITGMNPKAAQALPREDYRWQTDGEGHVKAYTVYKGRRAGEARFQAFKEYRPWLARYMGWLDDIGIEKDRLFPFVSVAMIPAAGRYRQPGASKTLCKSAGVAFVPPRALRKIRQNWLLRATANASLSAKAGAHAMPTLLMAYEEPHLAPSATRITKHYRCTDPSLAVDGAPCADPDHSPEPEPEMPPQAPMPDCVSPEGCLFCVHHMDIESPDYVWALASHKYLKSLERDNYERPIAQTEDPHPSDIVIDRILAKLNAFRARGDEPAGWVTEAEARVREGEFHPRWAGFIRLWSKLKEIGNAA